jgi:hypothetical protein
MELSPSLQKRLRLSLDEMTPKNNDHGGDTLRNRGNTFSPWDTVTFSGSTLLTAALEFLRILDLNIFLPGKCLPSHNKRKPGDTQIWLSKSKERGDWS